MEISIAAENCFILGALPVTNALFIGMLVSALPHTYHPDSARVGSRSAWSSEHIRDRHRWRTRTAGNIMRDRVYEAEVFRSLRPFSFHPFSGGSGCFRVGNGRART